MIRRSPLAAHAVGAVAIAALAFVVVLGAGSGKEPRSYPGIDVSGPSDAVTVAETTRTADRSATSGASALAPAGLYDLPSGRAQAIGRLERMQVPGGVGWEWALFAGVEGLAEPRIITIITNADNVPRVDPVALEGAYVVAEGTPEISLAEVAPPGPLLRADSLDRIEDVRTSGGARSLRGIPYRWARVEKPGLFRLDPNRPESDDGRVRVVGVLMHFDAYYGAENKWAIADMMPYAGGMSLRVAAFLEGSGARDRFPEGQPYVAVEGHIAGELTTGNGTVPVVSVGSISVVTTQQPVSDGVFH